MTTVVRDNDLVDGDYGSTRERGKAQRSLDYCAVASLGDATLAVILYGTLTLIVRRLRWASGDTLKAYVTLAGLGALSAVAVEEVGLAVRRWCYSARMPSVPGLKVGLWPVLQLALLVPLAAWLTNQLCQQRRDHQ